MIVQKGLTAKRVELGAKDLNTVITSLASMKLFKGEESFVNSMAERVSETMAFEPATELLEVSLVFGLVWRDLLKQVARARYVSISTGGIGVQ